MTQNKLLRYYLPAALQLSLIVFISTRPGEDLPSINIPFFDKFVHFGLFFGLSFLLVRALCHGRPLRNLRLWMLFALFFSCLYGYFDEFILQAQIPGRSVDWGDFIANCLGSAAGVLFVFLYFKIKRTVGALDEHGKVHHT